MNIDNWLQEFKNGWVDHDIEKIISLYDSTIEYWETPFKCLKSLEDLKTEWQAIKGQSHIDFQTEVFQSYEDSHTVAWKLKYIDINNMKQEWAGTYLIRLNSDGKCFYFYQTGEKSPK